MPDIDTTLLDALTDSNKFSAKGWKEVVLEYVFSRTEAADAMLARMYEGAYHPVIHLGLGVEFEQLGIVAEALAQAVAHDDSNIKTFFAAAEAQAEISYPTAKPKPVIDLIHVMRDGIVGCALDNISSIVSQFRIREE
ncbi:hypothetical protein VTK56DRAFT_3208 [Thermocarpiscus australiensis]